MNRAAKPARAARSSETADDGTKETYGAARQKFNIQGIQDVLNLAVKDNHSRAAAEEEAYRLSAHIDQQRARIPRRSHAIGSDYIFVVGTVGAIINRNRGVDVRNFARRVAGGPPCLLDIVGVRRVGDDIDLAHRAPGGNAADVMNGVPDIPRIDRLGKSRIHQVCTASLRDELDPPFQRCDLVRGTRPAVKDPRLHNAIASRSAGKSRGIFIRQDVIVGKDDRRTIGFIPHQATQGAGRDHEMPNAVSAYRRAISAHILIGDGLADLDDVRGNIFKGRGDEIIPPEVVFVQFFCHVDP
jgi:hypothetical protein